MAPAPTSASFRTSYASTLYTDPSPCDLPGRFSLLLLCVFSSLYMEGFPPRYWQSRPPHFIRSLLKCPFLMEALPDHSPTVGPLLFCIPLPWFIWLVTFDLILFVLFLEGMLSYSFVFTALYPQVRYGRGLHCDEIWRMLSPHHALYLHVLGRVTSACDSFKLLRWFSVINAVQSIGWAEGFALTIWF